MKFKNVSPAGHRVLIKVDVVEETTKSGIIIAHENKKRVNEAQVVGTLVKAGFQAWKDFSNGEPWAKAGDKVLYAEFAGYKVEIDGELHRVMNDADVTAVVEEFE